MSVWMTGKSGRRCLIWPSTSSPSMPGMLPSDMPRERCHKYRCAGYRGRVFVRGRVFISAPASTSASVELAKALVTVLSGR
jgi:hypothetical protein